MVVLSTWAAPSSLFMFTWKPSLKIHLIFYFFWFLHAGSDGNIIATEGSVVDTSGDDQVNDCVVAVLENPKVLTGANKHLFKKSLFDKVCLSY